MADLAFASPATSIFLPKQQQFHSPEAYYSTALHELGHWSDHDIRLDRAELMKGGFGSPEYAKEELRAEMTSVTVNGMLRLPHDLPVPES